MGMGRIIIITLLLFAGSTSFTTLHKFYVSIYQVHYSPEKKMLQVTSRIFIDDLNHALTSFAKAPVFFGEKEQTAADVAVFKSYMRKNLIIAVNGKNRELNYLSSEMEGNIVISYFAIRDVSKVSTLEVRNTALTDVIDEQQNIIQLTANKQKRNMLLTGSDPADTVTF